ncbi:MAG: 4-hydroxy-tetrahydrodipicolinate synthase [Christensenellaceae bacterium]|nr:4-hydroxy-tetrahydrodipicolinate synthase [Christensenellaceae bacterium]
MSVFKGSGVALVTPFNDKGIDYDSLKKIIDFQIDNKTDSILICGTTGEPATMSETEKRELIRFSIDYIDKRVPVMIGVGSNNTAQVIENAHYAEECGADSLLIVTPYYNKASQEGLYRHYRTISENVDTPVIIYNVPGRTGVNILPDTVKRLCGIRNISGIKEASGNISQITELILKTGGEIDVYSGDDSLTYPIMSVGGIGVISVAANIIPLQMHELTQACLDEDMAEAKKIHLEYYDLFKGLFTDVSPIPVKTAMGMMGLCGSDVRLPLCEMDSEKASQLRSILKKHSLI